MTVRHADGSQIGASEGNFDIILLSGSVGMVPRDLLQQLNVGGRLAAIVGDEPVMQCTIVTRTSETDFRTTASWETVVQRLQGFAEPERFQF